MTAAETNSESAATSPAAGVVPAHPPVSVAVAAAPSKYVQSGRKGGSFLKVVVRLLFAVAVIGGGLSAGLLLQKHFMPVRTTAAVASMRTMHSGEASIVQYLESAFARAQKRIVVYAGRDLTSKKVLLALGEQVRRGVDVTVVFSIHRVPDAERPVVAFLKEAGVRRIYIHREPAMEQFAVIDGRFVIHSEIPWATPKPHITGFTHEIPNPKLAERFERLVQMRLSNSIHAR